MKKVFEKIIERLEEKENEFILKAPNTSDFNNKDYQKWMMKSFGFKEAMKIVQEVEEEYATDTNVGSNDWIMCSSGVMPKECITKDGGKMTEKEKALKLIKELREASYNHTYYGKDMAIDEEMAVFLVEEIFEVEEPID